MKSLPVAVRAIGEGKRLRPLSEPTVNALVESMKAIGLLQPIVIHRPGGISPYLVAGAHRLEAAKRLKWESIMCVELPSTDKLDVELAEIDENLMRAELTPAERAMHIAARKRVYELRYPETKHGAAKKQRGQVGPLVRPSFNSDLASKTGRSERDVKRDATRAKHIPEIAATVGTSLDSGAELDALAKLPHPVQHNLIERAKQGETVTAKVEHVEQVGDSRSQATKDIQWKFKRLTRNEQLLFVRWLQDEFGICQIQERPR